MALRRFTRLPAPVRTAIVRTELTYGADPHQYTEAVEELKEQFGSLPATAQDSARAELAVAYARARARLLVARVSTELSAERFDVATEGHFERWTVHPSGFDPVTLTVPAPTDEPALRDLVTWAREAALTGTCPRCQWAVLVAGGDPPQVSLRHAPWCSSGPTRLARTVTALLGP